MILPETAKPDAISSEPALNVEQLGGRLNQNNSDALADIQARSLRERFALGYYFAAAVAPSNLGATEMNMAVSITDPVSKYSIPSDEHIRKLLQLAALRFLSLRARLLQDEVNQIGIALKSGNMTPDEADWRLEELGALDLAYPPIPGAQ